MELSGTGNMYSTYSNGGEYASLQEPASLILDGALTISCDSIQAFVVRAVDSISPEETAEESEV